MIKLATTTLRRSLAVLSMLTLAAAAVGPARAQPRAAVDYQFTGDIALGAPGFQDYLTFDPLRRRLYVSHYNRVTVVDAGTRRVLGQVGPFHDSHGVAIVDDLGKGYADSGADGVVKVFSLADLHIERTIKVSPDADGMLYDAHAGAVLVAAGDSKTLTLIDPRTDRVTKVIALPGKPEFLALDEAGRAFVNLTDVGAIAVVDLARGKTEATWPLAGCTGPHGLAYDAHTRRLFSSCANGRLVVVDAADGRNLVSLPIGAGSDAVAVDSRRGLVFSSNGEGTLSVIEERRGDRDRLARTIPTFFGARNMSLDPASGVLFIAHGTMKLESSLHDLLNLRFGFDGVDVAVFEPRL